MDGGGEEKKRGRRLFPCHLLSYQLGTGDCPQVKQKRDIITSSIKLLVSAWPQHITRGTLSVACERPRYWRSFRFFSQWLEIILMFTFQMLHCWREEKFTFYFSTWAWLVRWMQDASTTPLCIEGEKMQACIWTYDAPTKICNIRCYIYSSHKAGNVSHPVLFMFF